MASVQSIPKPAIRRRTRRQAGVLPLLTLLTLAPAAAAAWWGWTWTHPSDDLAGKLLTATVTRGDLVETISATGSVTAQTGAEVKIGSQITGRIKRLYADVGSLVKAGQVIAELDLPDIRAQLDQARANLTLDRAKLRQQESGVAMQRTQTESAVAQARAQLRSAGERLAAAQAAAKRQTAQTPTDIERARTVVAAAQAALSTAESNLAQVRASANLQVATAQEQLLQVQANERHDGLNLQRQQALLKKGFVAASAVDDAQATATVSQSQVQAAQHNVQLVKEKVAADLQAAQDQVVQAQQNVGAAQAALAAAQAGTYDVDAKQADVQDARAQVRQAEANLQTALGNRAQNVVKQLDVEQARAAVTVAQAQVDYSQAQLQKTYIRTPISGTVLQLATQQGETVAAGLSAPTLIVVADLNRLEVDAYVDETDIGKVVRLGQEAEVTVDAFPGHAYKGEVTKIAAGSTIQQGVVTYVAGISVHDPKHRLRPDMTASVTIKTGERSNVLLVPAEAVKLSTRRATVNVLVRKNGKTEIERRRVKTGGSDGVNTEIRSGLQEGETVVLAGLEDSQKRHGSSSPFGPQKKEKKKAKDQEVSRLDFGFWILDFGLGRQGRFRLPAGHSAGQSEIQNPKSKIQNAEAAS